MPKYSGDPRWIAAKFTGQCAKCKKIIAKGSQIFYFPNGKTVFCADCGESESSQFNAAAFDEQFFQTGN